MAVLSPPYLHRRVKRTVRIGTLMPTPKVSVPQITLSNPRWANCSTKMRYRGSRPAWCNPMPARSHRLMSGPYGLENFTPSRAVAMAAFSSRVAVAKLVKS